MNPIHKRLKIINLAISITDIDTIKLQILKLNHIKMDEKLQNIINTLQSSNYAKAQTLINEYLKNPPAKESKNKFDNDIFDEKVSSLYDEFDKEVEPIEIKLDDMIKIQNENYEDITLSQHISKLDHTEDKEPKDYFHEEKDDTHSHEETYEENSIKTYEPIAYIYDKFQNMKSTYPPVKRELENYQTVQSWLNIIENDGYNEDNVEEIINYIYKISNQNKAEAAELLLLTACTKSKYAEFILARELYRGNIIKQNIEEAFNKMYDLAKIHNYPEAICDLAQFYEHGVGVKKDIKEAIELYDEAMQLGITRAIKHYDRLSKQKKGLLNIF